MANRSRLTATAGLTANHPRSLARHWLVKRVGPSRSRCACCIRGSSRVSLSLSLLFASLSALTFPIGKRERVVSHESASRETVGGFPRVDECCCAGSIFSPRWPAGPGRVVPAYKSLSPNPPLLPVRSTSPSITLSTQARTPNNLP